MMFWNNLRGMIEATLTGADPSATLHRLVEKNITLYHVQWLDELTVKFRCSSRDRYIIERFCRSRGDKIQFDRELGIGRMFHALRERPVMSAGMLTLFLLTMILPTRIFFFQVEGNDLISDREILAEAEACGIRFGASRRALRSEKMKNALLEAMPELKWAGINTAGCTAVISVREQEHQEDNSVSAIYGNMVAVRDGYITSCTVTRGNGLCKPGQIVREGQILISGYTDCGICIRVTGVEGEVYAQTNREFRAVTPRKYILRGDKKNTRKNISLIIGKKRINLWKDSGISHTSCGRMYEEYYITLPGGFLLPVRLCIDTVTEWSTVEALRSSETVQLGLEDYSRKAVTAEMSAGSILQEAQYVEEKAAAIELQSKYLCSEMIGRVITEEIGETNGKTD